MGNLSELSGYVASTLVLLTFVAKDMRLLRTVAIFSNLAFITYGTLEWLPPVLFLHMVLLPLNVVRLAEIVRGTHGVVRAQTLRADVTAPGQPPVVPWSSAHRTQRVKPSRSEATSHDHHPLRCKHVMFRMTGCTVLIGKVVVDVISGIWIAMTVRLRSTAAITDLEAPSSSTTSDPYGSAAPC